MQLFRKYFVLIFLLFTMDVATADPIVIPAAVPKNLHVYNAAGNTYVDTIAYDCSQVRYHLNPGHAKYDAIYSMLLAAQISGKKVQLRIDGCNTIAQGNIIGIYLVE
jgi:hypothetical protein